MHVYELFLTLSYRETNSHILKLFVSERFFTVLIFLHVSIHVHIHTDTHTHMHIHIHTFDSLLCY